MLEIDFKRYDAIALQLYEKSLRKEYDKLVEQIAIVKKLALECGILLPDEREKHEGLNGEGI